LFARNTPLTNFGGRVFAFPEQFWKQLTGEIMSVMAISRKQVKQASQNLGQVLKAQADYVVQALDELLTNKGDKSELRSIFIAGVQNIKVRDFILCHIATHDSEQELIEVLAETALKAPEKDCEQVAAMVAILLKANDAEVSRIRQFIDLGNELSLAQLVGRQCCSSCLYVRFWGCCWDFAIGKGDLGST